MTPVLTTVVATAAALGALGYIARTVLRITRRMLEVADVILGSDEHPALAKRLDRIEHELQPNSGLSLRDSMDRVEDVTNTLASDLRGLNARVNAWNERLGATEEEPCAESGSAPLQRSQEQRGRSGPSGWSR